MAHYEHHLSCMSPDCGRHGCDMGFGKHATNPYSTKMIAQCVH